MARPPAPTVVHTQAQRQAHPTLHPTPNNPQSFLISPHPVRSSRDGTDPFLSALQSPLAASEEPEQARRKTPPLGSPGDWRCGECWKISTPPSPSLRGFLGFDHRAENAGADWPDWYRRIICFRCFPDHQTNRDINRKRVSKDLVQMQKELGWMGYGSVDEWSARRGAQLGMWEPSGLA